MDYTLISFGSGEVTEYVMRSFAAQNISPQSVNHVAKAEAASLLSEGSSADCVIIVGGGETAKKLLAKKAGVQLAVSETAGERYNVMLKKNSAYALSPKAYEKFVSYPEGFEVLKPLYGAECGAVRVKGKKMLVYLPEEKEDALYIFSEEILPRAVKCRGYELRSYQFKLFGADRAEMKRKLSEMPKSRGYTLSSYTDYRKDTLIGITFSRKTEENEEREVISRLYNLFSEYIYADSDISLEQSAVDTLKVRKKKVGVGESLTGGLISSKIVSVAGASEVFDEGFVTYANESKHSVLNVNEATLRKYGAVSDQTAYEMAVGLLSRGCDYAVATTGIAGPEGGSAEKPVGLCFTAVGNMEGIHIYRQVFEGDRNGIREQIACDALFKLIRMLS